MNTADSMNPELTKKRMSITLSNNAVPFVNGFADRHADICQGGASVVELGLMLLKLTEQLGPNEILAVVDKDTGTNIPIVLPWLEGIDKIKLPPL
jgi:hypothetical protein